MLRHQLFDNNANMLRVVVRWCCAWHCDWDGLELTPNNSVAVQLQAWLQRSWTKQKLACEHFDGIYCWSVAGERRSHPQRLNSADDNIRVYTTIHEYLTSPTHDWGSYIGANEHGLNVAWRRVAEPIVMYTDRPTPRTCWRSQSAPSADAVVPSNIHESLYTLMLSSPRSAGFDNARCPSNVTLYRLLRERLSTYHSVHSIYGSCCIPVTPIIVRILPVNHWQK